MTTSHSNFSAAVEAIFLLIAVLVMLEWQDERI